MVYLTSAGLGSARDGILVPPVINEFNIINIGVPPKNRIQKKYITLYIYNTKHNQDQFKSVLNFSFSQYVSKSSQEKQINDILKKRDVLRLGNMFCQRFLSSSLLLQ